MPNRCHCGQTLSFKQCCQPLLNKQRIAHTAEQLMRSRFSAFCTANIDYLINTHHPSKRHANDQQELANIITQCEWLQLKIISCKQGNNTDIQGEVEFIATYTQQGQLAQLHEKSRFVKEGEQWFYLDGNIFDHNNKP